MAVHPSHLVLPPPRARRRSIVGAVVPVVLLVVVLVIGAGCSGPTSPDPRTTSRATVDRPTVVATTDIVASLVRALAGDVVSIDPLLGRGEVAPTSWRPGDDRLAEARDADLVVAVGGGWEPWLADARAARTIELAPLLNPIPAGGSELATAATGSGAPGTAIDPRFWLDPDRATQAARHIADELIAIGLDRTVVEGRLANLARALARADEAAQASLGPIPDDRRTLLSPDAGVSYVADRYGFTVQQTTATGSPIPSVLVVDAVAARTAGTAPPTGGDGLPVAILFLDALAPNDGTIPGTTDRPDDVPSLIEANAAALAAALS